MSLACPICGVLVTENYPFEGRSGDKVDSAKEETDPKHSWLNVECPECKIKLYINGIDVWVGRFSAK